MTLAQAMPAGAAQEPPGRAVAQGGTVVRDKMPIGPYGFIALITDPDENLIGLHSMR